MRRSLVLAVLLLAALVPAPAALAAESGIVERLFIDSTLSGVATRFMAFDTTKRTLFDVDGDGILEIIAQNDNGKTYVLRGSDGAALSELATVHPMNWGARDINDVAVGDVNGNGRIDLVIANSVGYVTVYELKEKQPTPDKLEWTRLWDKKMDPREINSNVTNEKPYYDWTAVFPGMDGGAYLADVNNDGKLEIFVQTDNQPGFFALNHDGSLRWGSDWSDGNANPWVDDLDGDGRLDVVFVSDGGGVYTFDASNGAVKGVFIAKRAPAPCAAVPGAISVSPGVADLDGDGRKEILVGARVANGTEEQAKDAAWRAAQDARIYAVEPNGAMKWCFTAPWLAPHVYMHPAVVDVDGDGKKDAIFTDWNTIGHKPGSWESVGPPHLFVLNHRGELLWKRDLQIPWSNKDVAVADVDGDGKQEILVADAKGGREGVSVLSLDGKEEQFIGAPAGWGVSRGPQVADLDDNGKLEILLPVWRGAQGCPGPQLDVGCREGALLVLATPGKEAAFPGVFHFNHQYETAYDGKAPKQAKPPEVTKVLQTGVLSGVVRDEDGPVEGATVVIRTDRGEVRGTSDEDGRFVVRAPAGTWPWTATAFGHDDANGNVTLRGARVSALEVTMAETALGNLIPDFVAGPMGSVGLLAAGAAVGVVLLAALVVGLVRWRRRRA